MSDDLVFSDEPAEGAATGHLAPWQILIVDDEPAVHDVTKLAMAGFEMDGRPLQFTHCYSASEAYAVLSQKHDFALVLLDVVMESENAGLNLARQIREDIGDLNIRIILRTGQPGQAPEELVIRNYDINDYKEKTDLTRRKLITAFYCGLRGYRDLLRIEHARKGLRRSIEAISEVYESQNLRAFASAVLEQVNYLLNLNAEGLCATRMSAVSSNLATGRIKVLAATQAYSGLMIDEEVDSLPAEVRTIICRALEEKYAVQGKFHYAGYYRTKAGSESVIYMQLPEPLKEDARQLLEIFSSNVAITYDALLRRAELENSQIETIDILGSAIETRSAKESPHPQRVADIAAILATAAGDSEQDIALLKLAASLHDVGKICVSDAILTKPGPLTDSERSAVQAHALEGHDLLQKSQMPVHILAATIAHQHHEFWDGTGYPQGLAGEAIHRYARMVAIADVFESLASDSVYKKAWPLDATLDYVAAQSGKQFDPALIALLQLNLEAVCALFQHIVHLSILENSG